MAIRAALLVCIILVVLPAFSDGPKKSDVQPEFFFTRLMYHDIYGHGPAPGERVPDSFVREHHSGDSLTRSLGYWMMDTWNADYQYMWGIQRLTNVKLFMEPHPLPILDPDLFKFPYAYAVEPGHMELSDEEAARLREYLLRGGFLHVDDFWGLREWAQLAAQMKKIFPEREIFDLPMDHEIFHTFFDIDHIMQVPNCNLGAMYTRTGGQSRTWEQADDKDPHVRGISDDTGRLMVLMTYNSDFGDAWECADIPDYPAKFTSYAYRLGMNSIIYAMTH